MHEPLGHDERQQHLDRAEDHEHEHAGEQQRPQQPRGARHEAEPVAQITQQMRSILFCDNGSQARSGRHQQGQTRTEQNGHSHRAQRRERRTHQQAGDGRPDSALEHRPHHPFDTVGGQQLIGRQDPGQQCAVGREEERRGHTESAGGDRHVPDPQCPRTSQRSNGRGDHGVDSFDHDDDRALVEPVGGQSAHQHEGDQPGAQARGDQRQ